MEFRMALDVANVEANAKVAVAAFDSLGATITSTGNLLATLYGLIGDEKLDTSELEKVWAQIEKENEARQTALELQEKLVSLQIEYMQTRLDAMKGDKALVTIDGAGLQPHLEAFMWEILAAIQIQVNKEGLELLVGI
jgi:hypothetical protein